LCIDESAFENCSTLSSIVIPSSVERLSHKCFSGCTALSTITFEPHSHLSRIDRDAFDNCSSLSSVRIPSSMGAVIRRRWRSLGIPHVEYDVRGCAVF
jgi:hypothetical protein